MGDTVYCVLPAFNEEEAVRQVSEETKKYVDEVLVVDDGSIDKTSEMAAKSGATVIQHQRNMGKGAALRTGFKEALARGADIVVTLDTDGEHYPKDIPKLVEPIRSGKADIVIGSRLHGGGEKGPLMRKFSRSLTTLVLSWLFDIHVSDTQSGFRCFSRKAIEKLDFKGNSFVAESEMLIDASREGLRIDEVPITYVYVGGDFPALRETILFILLCTRKILFLS